MTMMYHTTILYFVYEVTQVYKTWPTVGKVTLLMQ